MTDLRPSAAAHSGPQATGILSTARPAHWRVRTTATSENSANWHDDEDGHVERPSTHRRKGPSAGSAREVARADFDKSTIRMAHPHLALQSCHMNAAKRIGCMARESSSRSAPAYAGRVVERLLQVDRGIGLGDEPQPLGLHAGGLGARSPVAAGDDHRQAGKAPAHLARQLLAAHAGQAEIGQKQVEQAAARQEARAPARRCPRRTRSSRAARACRSSTCAGRPRPRPAARAAAGLSRRAAARLRLPRPGRRRAGRRAARTAA